MDKPRHKPWKLFKFVDFCW